MFSCPRCGADRRKLPPVAPCPKCGVVLDDAGASLAMVPAGHSRRRLVIAIGATLLVAGAIVAVIVVKLTRDGGNRSSSGAVANVAKPATQPAATLPPSLPPPPPMLPEWIEIRVQRVQVAAGREWDGPTEERGQDQCRDLAELAMIVPKVGKGISILCEAFTTNAQRQADPRHPDLQLLLEAPGVKYRSYISFDQQSQLFDYPFMVPSAALSEDGVVVTVVDNDQGSERGEEIGSLRLRKQWLLDAWQSNQLQTQSPDGLTLIEINVSERSGELTHKDAVFEASAGGAEVAGLEIVAGDFIRIKAAGTWQIGNWNDKLLDASGYPDDRLRKSNLERFRDVAHGGAVALVGRSGMLFEVPPTTCFRAVAPFSGVVWVGINDNQPGDNRGTVSVRVHRRGPSPGEWRRPGATFPCE